MTSNETVSTVRAFLESYRDAFERLDALIERILNPVGDDVVAFPTRR